MLGLRGTIPVIFVTKSHSYVYFYFPLERVLLCFGSIIKSQNYLEIRNGMSVLRVRQSTIRQEHTSPFQIGKILKASSGKCHGRRTGKRYTTVVTIVKNNSFIQYKSIVTILRYIGTVANNNIKDNVSKY